MRTVFAAVLVGCASATAHAAALDQNLSFTQSALSTGVGAIELYPIVEHAVPLEAPQSGFAASITPGTIALSLIALGGVVLGRLSEHKSGVSTLGPVR